MRLQMEILPALRVIGARNRRQFTNHMALSQLTYSTLGAKTGKTDAPIIDKINIIKNSNLIYL